MFHNFIFAFCVLFLFLFFIIYHLNNSVAYSDKSACSISGGSSIGGNSTATLGNDYPSLTISDDFPADILHEIDFSTNYGKLSSVS